MVTIPNILTVFRLFASILIIVPLLVLDSQTGALWAFLIFVGAAITDFFDGFIARKFHQESQLGKMLDPIADKVMVLISFIILAAIYGETPFLMMPMVLIIFREVLVSGIREYLGDKASTLTVTNLAKWKTTIQMIAIASLYLGLGLNLDIFEMAGTVLLWIAALLTLMTGFDYFVKALGVMEN